MATTAAKNPRKLMERLLTPIREGRLSRVVNRVKIWVWSPTVIAKELLAGQGEKGDRLTAVASVWYRRAPLAANETMSMNTRPDSAAVARESARTPVVFVVAPGAGYWWYCSHRRGGMA